MLGRIAGLSLPAGVAEDVAAGKSIQSRQGTEGCLTKPDGKAVVSSFGTWVGPCGPCAEPGGHPQRENGALDSLKGSIVWGCWELKRKFRFTRKPNRRPSSDQMELGFSFRSLIRYNLAQVGFTWSRRSTFFTPIRPTSAVPFINDCL